METGERLRFAVSTPWGVKFDENIMIILQNDLFVIVGYNDLNGALLLLGNGLRLDAWANLAIYEVLNEFANIIMCYLLVLVEGELLVLDGLLDCKCGPLVNLEVQIASVCAESLSVNCRKADGSFVLLSERLEGLRQFSALLWGFSEDIGEGDTSLEDYQQIDD